MGLGNYHVKGGYDLTRGTRGKTHPLSAFKVAHLAAGGCFFGLHSSVAGLMRWHVKVPETLLVLPRTTPMEKMTTSRLPKVPHDTFHYSHNPGVTGGGHPTASGGLFHTG